MSAKILRLNKAGTPIKWINYEQAASLYVKNQVLWTLGDSFTHLHGGICRMTQEQSVIALHPIVATEGRISKYQSFAVALTNDALFQRDQSMCLYCGNIYNSKILTRDHVIPKGQGGKDIWENVVSACFACNNKKGCRTPEQAKMKLLAVPFRPNRFEMLVLSNKRILGDQMDYIKNLSPNFRIA
ncbi:HNH endonuclease [Pleionea sp. CnH1-48]|uniref:HNH endonuclease n=1 Tax=Pleionea sp. CnH1-48 TaxID=2954494 RepID=UPI002098052A|nr:HNH endonuclease [Pleionea sp. CnH1-48]MCO7226726.1 HNH endonuclease [Pleionea sp. CnH1-48]